MYGQVMARTHSGTQRPRANSICLSAISWRWYNKIAHKQKLVIKLKVHVYFNLLGASEKWWQQCQEILSRLTSSQVPIPNLQSILYAHCSAHQCSPLRRKCIECSIINPALSLLMKHLVIGHRQKAHNFSAFHWSPHSSLVSIGQHFVTTKVVHLPKRTKTSLITESDQITKLDQAARAVHSCNSWFTNFSRQKKFENALLKHSFGKVPSATRVLS